MKAKHSQAEFSYKLNEGKHKKTLLEKYLSEWTGNERVNASVNLERSDVRKEVIESPQAQFKTVTNKQKDFLNKVEKRDSEEDLLELDSLLKSKTR